MKLRLPLIAVCLSLGAGAEAMTPAYQQNVTIEFEPGSSTVAPTQRKMILDVVHRQRIEFLNFTLSTEASMNDPSGVQAARLENVSKHLQANGVDPGRIRLSLVDFDPIRAQLLAANAYARAHNIPFSGWDTRQRDGVDITTTLADKAREATD